MRHPSNRRVWQASINEAMARREFPDVDPIGRRFSCGPGEDGKPQWLEIVGGLVYGISTIDPLTFVSLPVVLGVVAFVAGLLPALRATRVDPLEALRVD